MQHKVPFLSLTFLWKHKVLMGENVITSTHSLEGLKKSAAMHIADIKAGAPHASEIRLSQQDKCMLIITPLCKWFPD